MATGELRQALATSTKHRAKASSSAQARAYSFQQTSS